MPNRFVVPGYPVTLDENIVKGQLAVIGADAEYAITIGDGAESRHVARVNPPNVHAVNNAIVTVANLTTTPGARARPNLEISW
jgi:hypothetical protein